jgi:hypothetical protein
MFAVPHSNLQNSNFFLNDLIWDYVGFEVFTAVTMKNSVCWNIRTQFVLHRRHITSPLPVNATKDLRYSRRRMPFSGMWRRVALVRTDVTVEHITSIIKVTKIGKLGTTLAVTVNRRTLQRNTNLAGYFSWQLLLSLLLVRRNLLLWRWRWYVPPKRRLLQEPKTKKKFRGP